MVGSLLAFSLCQDFRRRIAAVVWASRGQRFAVAWEVVKLAVFHSLSYSVVLSAIHALVSLLVRVAGFAGHGWLGAAAAQAR